MVCMYACRLVCVCMYAHTGTHTHVFAWFVCIHPCASRPEWKRKTARAPADRLDAADARINEVATYLSRDRMVEGETRRRSANA
jgi:hypothetical protein